MRWRPKYEGIGPFSKLNLESSILSTEKAIEALGRDRFMPIYPWSKNYIQRKSLNSGNRLPDYDLDPPEDDPEYPEDSDQIDDYIDIDYDTNTNHS
jgi:hypothetical protein